MVTELDLLIPVFEEIGHWWGVEEKEQKSASAEEKHLVGDHLADVVVVVVVVVGAELVVQSLRLTLVEFVLVVVLGD